MSRFLLIAFVLVSFRAAAQKPEKDSLKMDGATSMEKIGIPDSLRTYLADKDFFLFESINRNTSIAKDSSFNHLHNYFERNLMGNIGFPDYEYLLSYKEDPIGVRWFSSPYDSKLMGLTEHNLYWKKGLNTNVFAAAGTRQQQVLKLSHIQNIGDKFNFSLKLNRYGSLGFYQFQQSFVNNVSTTTNYISKHKRFGFYTMFSFDRFKHLENGGITSDTSIIKDPIVDKSQIPVSLKSAKRNYSLMAASVRLFFKLNPDSLSTVNHFILFGADGSMTRSIYNDVPSDYYNYDFIDSTITTDTIRFNKLSPNLSYNLVTKNINFELGSQLDYVRWSTPDTDRVFNIYKSDYTIDYTRFTRPDTMHKFSSVLAFQRFAWGGIDKTFNLVEKASYIVSGKNAGDYSVTLNAGYYIKFLKTSLTFNANSELRSPDLFFNYNRVNNYYWKNNFEKSSSNNIAFDIHSAKLKLSMGVVHRNINRMILLYNVPEPIQLSAGVSVTRLYLKHHLKVFKFHLENQINYQLTETYVLPMPSLYTQHQLYFEQRVKRNGLRFQIGVQANYVGPMEIVSYDPSLNSFFVNAQEKKGGNYVFFDAFFNVYFKPVKFFVKVEHANQGYMGTNYTLLNGYYQPDRAIRFGLNWEFWD